MNEVGCTNSMNNMHFNKADWDAPCETPDEIPQRSDHAAICEDCDIAMVIAANQYECPVCGLRSTAGQWDAILSGANGGVFKFGNGRQHAALYVTKTDSDETKYRKLIDKLHKKWQAHWIMPGRKIPWLVIQAAAKAFVAIRPAASSEWNLVPTAHRRSRKYEIICALIKIIGNRTMIMHDAEIAKFMDLDTAGFAKGEQTICQYALSGVEGLQGLQFDQDFPFAAYFNRYLVVLNIDSPDHRGFIEEVVTLGIEGHFAYNTKRSSKIIGCIWMLIEHKRLCIDGKPIIARQLEQCTGGTKKSTFCKFPKIVLANIGAFAEIFEKYSVPLAPPALAPKPPRKTVSKGRATAVEAAAK